MLLEGKWKKSLARLDTAIFKSTCWEKHARFGMATWANRITQHPRGWWMCALQLDANITGPCTRKLTSLSSSLLYVGCVGRDRRTASALTEIIRRSSASITVRHQESSCHWLWDQSFEHVLPACPLVLSAVCLRLLYDQNATNARLTWGKAGCEQPYRLGRAFMHDYACSYRRYAARFMTQESCHQNLGQNPSSGMPLSLSLSLSLCIV